MKGCRLCLGFCLLDPDFSGGDLIIRNLWKGSRNGEDLMKASSNMPVSVLRSRSSRPSGAPDNCSPSRHPDGSLVPGPSLNHPTELLPDS